MVDFDVSFEAPRKDTFDGLGVVRRSARHAVTFMLVHSIRHLNPASQWCSDAWQSNGATVIDEIFDEALECVEGSMWVAAMYDSARPCAFRGSAHFTPAGSQYVWS
jgi:hypothetical protein